MATRKQEGATRTTVFDDVFRTMAQKMPELLIPLINEVFGKSYAKDEKINQLRNKHFEKNGEIITDAILVIKNVIYHIECQSTKDKNMTLRMFEYDFAIALEQAANGTTTEINFPNSCVVYLRNTRESKTRHSLKVNFPNGQSCEYETKVIRVKDYTMEDMFSKKLLFFLPFYLMRYEYKINSIAKDEKRARELIDECEKLRTTLEQELYDSRSELFADIVTLITNISDHIFRNKETLKKGVNNAMGGKIMMLESERLEKRGEKRGKKIGREEVIFELVSNGVITPEKGAEMLKTSKDGLFVRMKKNKFSLPM